MLLEYQSVERFCSFLEIAVCFFFVTSLFIHFYLLSYFREVTVTLEGVDKQGNFFASIQYAGRDVAEELLKQGFATFVPWSATPRGADVSAR